MSGKRPNTRDTLSSTSEAASDEAPELTGEELNHPLGVWRIGETPVSTSVGMQALRQALIGKTRVNIHLDNDVIAYFKDKARGRGYQTLINAALRDLMESETNDRELREVIRQTIREEFAAQHTLGSVDRNLAVNTTMEMSTVDNWKN